MPHRPPGPVAVLSPARSDQRPMPCPMPGWWRHRDTLRYGQWWTIQRGLDSFFTITPHSATVQPSGENPDDTLSLQIHIQTGKYKGSLYMSRSRSILIGILLGRPGLRKLHCKPSRTADACVQRSLPTRKGDHPTFTPQRGVSRAGRYAPTHLENEQPGFVSREARRRKSHLNCTTGSNHAPLAGPTRHACQHGLPIPQPLTDLFGLLTPAPRPTLSPLALILDLRAVPHRFLAAKSGQNNSAPIYQNS